MVRTLLMPMAFLIAMPAAAQVVADPNDGIPNLRANMEAAYQILGGMEDSAKGWNSGDIDRFLAIYSDDPATSFAGSDGVTYGKTRIRARYLKSYDKQFGAGRDPAGMSKLSFVRENFSLIGSDHALLIARWTLVTGDGKTQTGMTSLLFRKEADGWRIIADHSS